MSNKGITICISSAKGGVGKTISTLNLAGIYKILGKKVLIVDFDLASGGIASALNVEVRNNIYNLVYDINNNQYKEFKNYVYPYIEGIDILASPKDPRQAMKIDHKYVEVILDKAIFNYDVVLIDTNHVLSEFNVLTMDSVDKMLFFVTNDPLDLKNMRSLMAILKDVNYVNYKVVLNESVTPFKKYFSLYDIKNIINSNVDYVLSKDFYIKNIDNFIMNGKIITLDDKAHTLFGKDYTTLMQIATDMLDIKEVK